MKYKKYIVPSIFFIVLLITGLSIFDDYGVHWDEYNNQRFGKKWYNFSLQFINSESLLDIKADKHDLTHGPIFEITLIGIEKFFDLNDSREIILYRHFTNFLLFFIGTITFYFLNKKIFGKCMYAIIACTILILHPRIFAHSFYNTVDIPFMVFYLISTFTLIHLLDRKTLLSAIIHAITCAILIDIRIAGLILPACTVIFLFLEFAYYKDKIKILNLVILYGFTLIILIIAFWPYLWHDPVNNMIPAIQHSKFANFRSSPWTYNFLYISVTTPILYLFLFLTGFTVIIAKTINNPVGYYKTDRNIIISLLLIVFPLILPIIFQNYLFDEWRHHYFIYPIFAIILIYGLINILELIKTYTATNNNFILNNIIFGIIILSLSNTLFFMIKNHPHQQTYSNFLAGKDNNLAKVDDTLDYWGLSYREVLEYILKIDNGDNIRITYKNIPAVFNSKILPIDQRNRIQFVPINNADYLVTNYRRHKPQLIPDYFKEIYSVKVDGIKIAAAYKRIGINTQ